MGKSLEKVIRLCLFQKQKVSIFWAGFTRGFGSWPLSDVHAAEGWLHACSSQLWHHGNGDQRNSYHPCAFISAPSTEAARFVWKCLSGQVEQHTEIGYAQAVFRIAKLPSHQAFLNSFKNWLLNKIWPTSGVIKGVGGQGCAFLECTSEARKDIVWSVQKSCIF